MFRLFNHFVRRLESDRTLKMVIKLNKQGNNIEALKKCTDLVNQYPYDVQIRHRLAMLQREMGQEIQLPNIEYNSVAKPRN